MNWSLTLEIAGTLVGLIYLYYEYKAHNLLWLMSIIMSALSIAVYYNAGIYAYMGINIYYILAGIYGYIVWNYKSKRKRTTQLPITHMPRKTYIYTIAITICLHSIIYFILNNYTDSVVAGWDALTTSLSITAMWMLSRKYIEQWWLWIIVDILSVGLYIHQGIYLYAILYVLYTVIAVLGYFNWKKLMNYDNN